MILLFFAWIKYNDNRHLKLTSWRTVTFRYKGRVLKLWTLRFWIISTYDSVRKTFSSPLVVNIKIASLQKIIFIFNSPKIECNRYYSLHPSRKYSRTRLQYIYQQIKTTDFKCNNWFSGALNNRLQFLLMLEWTTTRRSIGEEMTPSRSPY